MVLIRKATEKDVESVYLLFLDLVDAEDKILKAISPHLMKTRIRKKNFKNQAEKEIKKEIHKKNSLLLVAVQEKQIIGYGVGAFIKKKDPLFEEHMRGFVYTLVVKKEYQRQGISTKLHEKLLNWLKRNKCDLIFIGLFAENPSNEIYRKWGYKDYNVDMVK